MVERRDIGIISLALLVCTIGVIGVTLDNDGINVVQEVEAGTNPIAADTDGDGLNDSEELNVGTDPTKKDTDGDGINDFEEIQIQETVPEADLNPLQKDIILEVDYYEGKEPPEKTVRIIEETFNDAPVRNPDGSEGINAHVIVDESFSGNGSVEFDEYKENHYQEMYDYNGKGAYHVLIVGHAVPSKLGIIGKSGNDIDGVLVDDMGMNEEALAHVIIHEMGHQLGLTSSDYEGIDSRNISYVEYPSIMNYNAHGEKEEYNFSSGEGFDDWDHINQSLAQGASPSTSNVSAPTS